MQFCFLSLCVWGFLLWISVEEELRLRGSSGTTVLSTIKSVMYNVFYRLPPPFFFKLETNLFNLVGSIDLISSESIFPLLCASSWGQNVQTWSDLGTNSVTCRLKYFHCTEWRQYSPLKTAYIFINKSKLSETVFLMSLVNDMFVREFC